MNCEDYICDDDECLDICDNCSRMVERSCVNCALNESCDGDNAYHDKMDYDDSTAQM